jgi:hypothetical protein
LDEESTQSPRGATCTMTCTTVPDFGADAMALAVLDDAARDAQLQRKRNQNETTGAPP